MNGVINDEYCWARDSVLSSIYSIATGEHNWPEAMPYNNPLDLITKNEAT